MTQKLWLTMGSLLAIYGGSLVILVQQASGRSELIPPIPPKPLDKAGFERYLNNPDEWLALYLRMTYQDPSGHIHSFVFNSGEPQSPRVKALSVTQTIRLSDAQSEREEISHEYEASPPPANEVDGFFLLLKKLDLFSLPLPHFLPHKDWRKIKAEVEKKSAESFLLVISLESKEEIPHPKYPKILHNARYITTIITDFPEPRNEEEKKALAAVREILKFAKEKFIDYGMKNYWCKKEYKGGKVVKAEPGNQPIPKYKECKPELR